MTPKQLSLALSKLHPDYQDTDMIVMYLDNNEEVKYQSLAYVGIATTEEHSAPVIGTKEVVLKMAEHKRVKMIETGLPPTEKDLSPPDQDEI